MARATETGAENWGQTLFTFGPGDDPAVTYLS